ncbi:MAG: type IX secretion system outer membrane channel protein PorV, partial [Luteibaculum sp.]
SIHWNPAKLAFLEKDFGIALSYVPWLRAIVPDMNIAYLTGFQKINDNSTVATSLRYFSLGNIQYTDEQGNSNGSFTPNEFAFDGAYALKLSEYFSAGVALRFIYSNLSGGSRVAGADTRAGTAFAFDASLFYKSKQFQLSDKDAYISSGINISNIGNKMSYSTANGTDENFLPANMRLGATLTMELDKYNDVSFTVEGNKLLVPTPNGSLDTNTVSVASGVFGSFNDAPNGSSEELKEINLSVGIEYDYDDKLAFRLGFFNEAPEKGNRQFITLGAGLAYSVLKFDFSYLLSTKQNSPIANSLRVTISALLSKGGSKEDDLPPTLN